MAWVVDTCVIIDVLENDPSFGLGSAKLLKARLADGLVVCPVSMVELAPAFAGNLSDQKGFLDLCGIDYTQSFLPADAEAAHAAWQRYVTAKRTGRSAKRPVADLLIGGFAGRFQGLLSRNPDDFKPWFPGLRVLVP